jgi:hypothetical protein
MPPLYRMPVVYAAAILIGGAVVLASLARPRGDAANFPTAPTGPETEKGSLETGKEHPLLTPVADLDPEDGILRTADGLRRKVLIRRLGAHLRERPGDGPILGNELGLYSIWYLYGERGDHLQIGPATGGHRGWVAADSVLEWDTRVMVRPVSAAASLYEERSCLLDALAGRPCPKHPDAPGCPRARLPKRGPAERVPMGLPVLQSEAIPLPDGTSRTLFEVATLVREGDAPPPIRIADADREALRDIHIALVMDTTASMAGFIDRAKRVARSLADDAPKRYRDVRLHLALVEYRDDPGTRDARGFGFSSRITTPFVSPDQFLRALENVEATTYRDQSIAERVLEGVALALPSASPETPHLDWPQGRAGDLATKMLVLIGDAPDHALDTERAEALARQARDARITIAGVRIRNPSLVESERARYQAQWRALSAGSYRPLDRRRQFEQAIPPLELALDQADALVPGLQSLIDDRIERARQLAELARAEAEGRLEEYRNQQGLTMDQLAPVLEDLHRSAPPPELLARRGVTRTAPQVQRRWVALRHGDDPVVQIELLLSRRELDRLIEDLRQFQQAIQADTTSREDLIRVLSASASGDRGFLEADRGTQTFADYLRRQGLPPARPDSLLRRSQGDLFQTDRLSRAELDAALARALAELGARRQAPEWDDPSRLVDRSMSWVPYDPIDF